MKKRMMSMLLALTPDAYYLLPETVEVAAGGTGLTLGTDFSCDSATGVLTIPAASVKGDWEISAQALPQQFSVTHKTSGGTNPASNPAHYTVEDNVTLTAPTREGYTFTGWTWEGQEKPVLSVEMPAGTTGELRFTANWKENEKPPIRFTDVNADDWFYDPVYWAVETDITTGTTDATFSPADASTRAQGVTFLYRFFHA